MVFVPRPFLTLVGILGMTASSAVAAASIAASGSPVWMPRGRDRVRVLHLGDSHVAAEAFASAVRAFFVQRYGTGEGGLYLPDLLPRTGEAGSRFRLEGGWKVVPARSATDPETDLAGGWAESAARGATVRLAGPFSEGRILLGRQPAGGRVVVRVDGRVAAERRLAGPPGVEVIRVSSGAAGGHEIEIVAGGDGPVRFLGAVLDSSRQGALYFPVGVNGALASSLLKLPESSLFAQLQAVDPEVVILAFGTNEARTFEPEARLLSQQMATLVGRVRRALPAAFVVVVGPPDQARRTRSGGIAAVPARELVSRSFGAAARQEGALFVDLAEAMGGAGAVRAWNSERPPLVQEDLVHFTSPGYLRLARLLVGALDGRETMNRIPAAAAVPAGGVRFERDPSGRVRLTNQPSGAAPAPILGTARKTN